MEEKEEVLQQEGMNSSKGVAGFVLGILSMLAWILPLVGYPVAIVGLVLSVKAKKENTNGYATAGMILSIIGLCFTALNSFAGVIISLMTVM